MASARAVVLVLEEKLVGLDHVIQLNRCRCLTCANRQLDPTAYELWRTQIRIQFTPRTAP
jgi:hypothetical protein